MLAEEVSGRILGFLGDGLPHRLGEVAKAAGCDYGYASDILRQLVDERVVLVSAGTVIESHLEKGRRIFGKGRLYILAKSPLLEKGPIVHVKVRRVRRYTFEEETKEEPVRFVEAPPLQKVSVTQDMVLKFFEERGIGATSELIAEALNASQDRVSTLLHRMRQGGLIVSRGQWNPRLGKETPFMHRNLKGYVYGRPGTDDVEKFLQTGVLSKDVNIVLNEVLKNSRQKRFTMVSLFRETPYRFNAPRIQRSIRQLTDLLAHIKQVDIAGQLFLYDSRSLSEEDIHAQEAFWNEYVRKQKSERSGLGRFHEEFIRQALSMANFSIEAVWWRQQTGGEIKYNITLSNGREIDRVLEVRLKAETFQATILFPIEAKFIRGGVRPEQVQEFYDKLRNSWEFGSEVEMREQNQTFKVRVKKAYVVPLMITPFVSESGRKLANTLGITLIPTWRLEELAGKKAKTKMRVKGLFKEFLKSDLSAREFLDRYILNAGKVA